jgi:hypothetical protein
MSLEGLFDHDQGKCVEEPMPVLYAKRRRKKNGKAAYDMATTMENLHAGILVGKVNSSFTKRAYSVFDGGDKPRKGQTAQQPTMRKEMASVKMTANSYRVSTQIQHCPQRAELNNPSQPICPLSRVLSYSFLLPQAVGKLTPVTRLRCRRVAEVRPARVGRSLCRP